MLVVHACIGCCSKSLLAFPGTMEIQLSPECRVLQTFHTDGMWQNTGISHACYTQAVVICTNELCIILCCRINRVGKLMLSVEMWGGPAMELCKQSHVFNHLFTVLGVSLPKDTFQRTWIVGLCLCYQWQARLSLANSCTAHQLINSVTRIHSHFIDVLGVTNSWNQTA